MLPHNATAQEIALEAAATARLSDVPLRVRESWSPDTCPAPLLPWLAWAFSVDEWKSTWTEAEQRAVIRASLYAHKKKGTLSALKRVLEPLGYAIEIIEWFQDEPPATPHTFRLEASTTSTAVTEETYQQISRLIETYKNARSHMSALAVIGRPEGFAYFAAAITCGEITTVYPFEV